MKDGLRRLVERWPHPSHRPKQATIGEIRDVEERLRVRLPRRLVAALLEVGAPWFGDDFLRALSSFDDTPGGAALWEITDFLEPADIVAVTLGWRDVALAPDLIASASDGFGNSYCVPGAPRTEPRPETAPVWFFDHDFGTSEVVAPTLDDWLAPYLAVALR